MGGRLALASTLAGIAGLRALVIVSATPGIEDDSARQARRSEDERRAARLEKDGLSAFVSTWYAQPLFASLDHQPSLREDLIRRRTSGSSVELARALRGLSVGQQPSYWGELSRLPMPSLWVAGAEDTVYMKLTERAASLSPSSRTLMVRHSGHMPHGERPAECLGGIVDFLDQHLE
jgi:2-succinyl-6-hydroxy-2,4-cyclohexadiene-1-carboxylate synthase